MTEIAKLKIKLYGLLLKQKKQSDTEIDIMYHLSKDSEVQLYLEESMGKTLDKEK